jgi:undecaprenyl-diphosphatase
LAPAEILSTLDLLVYRLINAGLTSTARDPFFFWLSSREVWGGLAIAVFAYALARRDWRLVKVLGLMVLAVALSDVACTYWLKPAFQRVRPCHYLENARRVGGICGSEMGMPSNHAANGMAVAAITAVYFGWGWFALAVLLAVVVGFSRVYLGVHFPGDVLAGYGFGLVLGLVLAFSLRPYISRKKAKRS